MQLALGHGLGVGVNAAVFSTPGSSLTAPEIELLPGASANQPLFGIEATNPLENDVFRLIWDDAIPFVAQAGFKDYTLTEADLEGDFEFDFGADPFPNGDYTWHVVHMRGAISSDPSNDESDTIAVTAPVLSSPVDTKTGNATGSGTVSTTVGNGTLYWVVSTSATPPSVAQIVAGQMHTGAAAADSGSQAVSVTGVQTVTGGFDGLTPSTAYFAHYVHKDNATNPSNVASGDGFTTDASGNAPVNTVAPAITGEAVLGQTLTTSDGTWTGDATIVYTYQWKRGGSSIGGATNSTYVVLAIDEGQAIKCTVTGTNGIGNASADSNTVTIFTMNDLFASGEKGEWGDATDLTKMFQLSNGTTAVAADNDPVGYQLGGSPNAHAIIQATAANRPLYKTSGGLSWLEFDGVNDSLVKMITNTTNNVGYITMVVAATVTTNASVRALIASWGTINARAFMRFTSSTDLLVLGGRRLDADGLAAITGSVSRSGTPQVFIGEIDYTNSNASVHTGQTQDAATTSFHTDGSTSATDGALEIGNRSGEYFKGKVFQWLIIDRVLTAQERTNVGLRYAALSGATW